MKQREESFITRLARVTQLMSDVPRAGHPPVTPIVRAQPRGVPRWLAAALTVITTDRD